MKLLFATLLLVLSASAMGLTIEEMDWMTEQYPPYNYLNKADGQLKGITVDILMEIFKKIDVKKERSEIDVLPWARSYKYLLEKPGTALFSTTYTVERLQKFKFVGPVIPTKVSLIANKSMGVIVGSVEDMNQLKIGVVKEDIGEQLIRTLGVEDSAIIALPAASHMVRMLNSGRLDAIAYAEDIANYQFKLAELDPNQFEVVYVLKKSHMGYAFHNSTDPATLEPLRKALDELRADGTVDRIYEKYLR